MKRVHYIIGLAAAMLISVYLCSADDVITVLSKEQLPQTAQSFIDTYFSGEQIQTVLKKSEMLKTEYEVKMVGGKEVEFNGNGEWREVDCISVAVPEQIVPQQIMTSVKGQYPSDFIVKIAKDDRGWDVDLSSGVSLEFNSRFQLTDMD